MQGRQHARAGCDVVVMLLRVCAAAPTQESV